jgi:hypothetical protein
VCGVGVGVLKQLSVCWTVTGYLISIIPYLTHRPPYPADIPVLSLVFSTHPHNGRTLKTHAPSQHSHHPNTRTIKTHAPSQRTHHHNARTITTHAHAQRMHTHNARTTHAHAQRTHSHNTRTRTTHAPLQHMRTYTLSLHEPFKLSRAVTIFLSSSLAMY